MKKTLFVLIALFTINIAFAQNDNSIMLCNNNAGKQVTEKGTTYILSTTITQLLKCGEFNLTNSSFKITSFTLGMTSEGNYISVNTEGYNLSDKMIALIKKNEPKKIYIEKINVINNSGTKSVINPLTLILK